MKKVTKFRPMFDRCVVQRLPDDIIERIERDAGHTVLAANFRSDGPYATMGTILEVGPGVTEYKRGDTCAFVESTSLAMPMLGKNTYIIEQDALLGKPDVEIV